MKIQGIQHKERIFVLGEQQYDCAMEIEIEIERWEERHEPFYSEPMSEITVDVVDLSAKRLLANRDELEVEDKATLRQLRALAQEWAEEHANELAEGL